MFWKRKESPAGQPATPAGVNVTQPQAKTEQLKGPTGMPELMGRHLVVAKKKDPDWVWALKAVVKPSPRGKKAFDVRVFDQAQAAQSKVKVKDWTTLDEHPELVLYEGWFDKDTMKVEVEEKAGKAAAKPEPGAGVTIFTEAEIWQKITELSQPGSTVFFYLAGSPSSGGPLGHGAAVVELNPNYPGKGEKRFIIYTDDVDDGKPVGKRQKIFATEKSKEIAKWIKERHYKREAQ